MVTFCSITTFTSTIRGKEQSFHVLAMSGKVDSVSARLVLKNKNNNKKNTREATAVSGRISSWQIQCLLASSFHSPPRRVPQWQMRACPLLVSPTSTAANKHPDHKQKLYLQSVLLFSPLLQAFVSSSLQGKNTEF